MNEIAKTAPSLDLDDRADTENHATGILPSQAIAELVRNNHIQTTVDTVADQIQPASIDLRLGTTAYRVRASFMPGTAHTVEEKISAYGQYELDLTRGAVLERGCVYIVPLIEALALPSRISAMANPKSSTGRLDIFTRLITDHAGEFDRVERGYTGPLYAEISPRTFSVRVQTGSRLSQLRLRRGTPAIGEAALKRLHEEVALVDAEPGSEHISDGKLGISIDLHGSEESGYIGYKAKRDAGVIDFDSRGAYDPLDFWEPIPAGRHNSIVLNLDDFYILASKEAITVPPDHAAEMVAYDPLVGEFRVHYAGFFDPGFGHSSCGGEGSRAVLEVRSHEVPFMVEDGQIVGRMVYERLTSRPDKLYGTAIGSSYQAQGLRLSKHFRQD